MSLAALAIAAHLRREPIRAGYLIRAFIAKSALSRGARPTGEPAGWPACWFVDFAADGRARFAHRTAALVFTNMGAAMRVKDRIPGEFHPTIEDLSKEPLYV